MPVCHQPQAKTSAINPVQFRYDDFYGCLDQPFTLEHNGASYPLVLISVDRLAKSATSDDREAFSVIFRGDNSQILEQQIYRIGHDALGNMDLFIVPIGPDDEGMRYEAVFS